MEDGRRSGDTSSEYVVKNRSSSGCLIVRKKGGVGSCSGGDGVGPSGFGKGFDSREKKKKKRQRVEFSESGSSDELLVPPRRRPGSETVRVCNGMSGSDKRSGDLGRKIDLVGSERKRTRLDVFEFDEYDGNDVESARKKRMDDGGVDGRKSHGSIVVGKASIERDYETRSSRHDAAERRKSSLFGKAEGGFSGGLGSRHPINLLRDKDGSDDSIRVQGKNGVLKVMVNKKKNAGSGGSLSLYDRPEPVVDRKGPRTEDPVQRNVPVLPATIEKGSSLSGAMRSPLSLSKSLPVKNGKTGKRDFEETSTPLKLANAKVPNASRKPMPSKNGKVLETDSEDSDTSLKLRQKGGEVDSAGNVASKGTGKSPSSQPLPTKGSDGKVKRGTGTEKQKLRERIRQMLLDAGWTIDYRPRRNRDYLDAVYINPSGTAYWSIIKAYDALIKQLNDDEEDAKSADDDSPFTPLPDELLNQLTRKTKKKMEKEMKKKKKDSSIRDNARATLGRRSSSSIHDEESMDSGSREEKLSSFIKMGGKTLRSRTNGTTSAAVNSRGQSSSRNLPDGSEKSSSGPVSHQGRKSRKLGRCTLLVRSSKEGQDSEADGFVPFSGKRTILSWLIDCGTVQLSQKVLYMNRRRTKVMLEGWITRDGIHCGCCSKILTVSKFELHAGSKLRQPFQNICLESSVSLLECQVDAWNRQESIEQIDFHTVDVDGGDPNDDTCGICGDGGDLICCDGCPSTFHLSCLDIKMLPPGEWHCPNCTCKICGVASEKLVRGDDTTISPILTCKLCVKKYHKACVLEKDDLSVDTSSSISCFCGRNCRELFEQLQRYLGVKHELEGGFSWSLIHRTETDAETTVVGLPQRVESNSKLAVALFVMDECFLPIVDRRSGINVIRNVLYNCGSNFNRLNYGGFYTAILERGDEIISAASIRFHGTRLAEMPFIGTRHIYRRQGMCRRLFGAIELALSSLKVQKLVIPAVSELMNTWTNVFGFTTLNKAFKQELKSMNMLVFPGIDMLEKQFFQQERNEVIRGAKGFVSDHAITSELATKPFKNDHENAGAESVHHENEDSKMVTTYSASKHLDNIPQNGSSLVTSSADAPHVEESLLKETGFTHPGSENKLSRSAIENGTCKLYASDMRKLVGESNSQCPGVPSENDMNVTSVSIDSYSECKNVTLVDGSVSADSEPQDLSSASASGQRFPQIADVLAGGLEKKMELVAPVSDSFHSSRLDDGEASNFTISSDNTDNVMITSEGKKVDSEMVDPSCVDTPSFKDKPPAERFSVKNDETNVLALSRLHGEKADGTCAQLISGPNGEHAYKMDCKLHLASLSVPEEKCPDQSKLGMPEDGVTIGAGESTSDSGLISVPEAEQDDHSSVCVAQDGSIVDQNGVAEAKDHRRAPKLFEDGLSHDASDGRGDSRRVSVSEA